ncbi:hypothetical protein D9611_011365 [Ephemerocybe angulata]|uniref:Uncharacterized protein n=1 Tax=Ephemerocybe angulata TaxID=980116 RepID=A0A8H5F1C4_9AGAR|nr:hypothetical protein D9611_011365 [Tulosesus angulatus]
MFSPSHLTFLSGPLENPMFAFITHLELLWSYRLRGHSWNLPSFSSLQAMTHMCLSDDVVIDILDMFVSIRSWVPHVPTQLMVFALRIPIDPDLHDSHLRTVIEGTLAFDARFVLVLDVEAPRFDEKAMETWDGCFKNAVICRRSRGTRRIEGINGDFWKLVDDNLGKRRSP